MRNAYKLYVNIHILYWMWIKPFIESLIDAFIKGLLRVQLISRKEFLLWTELQIFICNYSNFVVTLTLKIIRKSNTLTRSWQRIFNPLRNCGCTNHVYLAQVITRELQVSNSRQHKCTLRHLCWQVLQIIIIYCVACFMITSLSYVVFIR